MKSSSNIQDIKEKFKSLLSSKNEDERLKHDAFILMSGYLSEIERMQRTIGINRKELARRIKTSPSYLTQVFRGDKPLNFDTVAKIQNELKIKFNVNAFFIDSSSISVPANIVDFNNYIYTDVQQYNPKPENNMYAIKGGNNNELSNVSNA